MWLRFSSLILFVTALCIPVATAAPAINLTDRDRAAIIGSVARDLFRTGRNYEGKHFILADGIRPNWIPIIPGYDVTLVTRNEIESVRAPIYYYVFSLRPLKHSVRVTVHLYDSETKTFPHVMLFYSYYCVGSKWRGLSRGGGGD